MPLSKPQKTMSLDHDWRARAAHGQARHCLLDEPALPAIGQVECRQLAIHGAHEGDTPSDRRSRQNFARHGSSASAAGRPPRSGQSLHHCWTRAPPRRRPSPDRPTAAIWSSAATGVCPSQRQKQKPCRRERRQRPAHRRMPAEAQGAGTHCRRRGWRSRPS